MLNVIEGIRERGAAIGADNTLAYLRKFFNWCVEREVIESSPSEKIKRMNSVQVLARARVLSEAEIRFVWQAFNLEHGPFGS